MLEYIHVQSWISDTIRILCFNTKDFILFLTYWVIVASLTVLEHDSNLYHFSCVKETKQGKEGET